MKVIYSLAALAFASLATAAQNPAQALYKKAESLKQAALDRRTAAHQPVKRSSLRRRSSNFLSSKTLPFYVNGTSLPDVDFDIGESYAGLLPISGAANETRELFFWFFPSSNVNASSEVTIWLNGGPGCSSLSGLLTENGPFTWEAGTLSPVQNSYSWTNLTNMLWVEQPVGVGFSQGVPNITNEVELGKEFVGFYQQFVKTFDVQNYDLYVTGESYAGYYVPYIAASFIDAADPEIPLKGIAINDPIIGDGVVQQQIPIVPFADYWQNLLYLNDTFMDRIHEWNDQCGYTDYFEKYLQYPPPPGPFPVLPDPFASPNYTCDVFDDVFGAILEVNPCFNIYHITDQCPHPWSVLGGVNVGDYIPPGEIVYFNRSDVQKAIHAPVGTNWQQCTNTNVFGGSNDNQTLQDTSLGPAQDGVLQKVIEYTNNVIIGSGNLDMLLSTNGTLLALQNTTWNGQQGFQCAPANELYIPYHPEFNGGSLAGAGVLGTWGSERGLTFYQAQLAGHELPGYTPGVGYRAIELLLGRISSLSDMDDFTTQSGNFTGTTPLYKRMAANGGYL
ncbi:hypothetical protein AMS68_002671 [Peltaster fructicola]|uniref:Carboxypeptidase n=1 Tax=Peltaster fructicola TaxID=286661 RepID=A0A6H0XQZ7_9PEZI|nr:hypothetical protein AMS68_002671 [Peltaster fructicola]